jgi:diguanylate cyclase (GGDEF)-like protein
VSLLPIVLVVDDEPANIDALASALEASYEVQFAMNGKEAIERAQTKPQPEVILLDVILPDIDGYEVCHRLKNDPACINTPIIFVTSLSNPAEEARGLEMGAADFITKPFSPAIVRARVKNQLAIKRTTEQLERLTLTDGLTGLANRRHFDSALTHEVSQLSVKGEPLSLVVLDVDFFKLYNDTYGHPQGDRCLQLVAHALGEHATRPLDLVARIGGEEFACLLPGSNHEGAMLVAQRLCEAVRSLAIAHKNSQAAQHVTISCGVATVTSAADASAVFQLADAALYRAKHGGRNRVAD